MMIDLIDTAEGELTEIDIAEIPLTQRSSIDQDLYIAAIEAPDPESAFILGPQGGAQSWGASQQVVQIKGIPATGFGSRNALHHAHSRFAAISNYPDRVQKIGLQAIRRGSSIQANCYQTKTQ
jgi:hypothetical protein